MKSRIQTIKVDDLDVDPVVQRALRKARVEEMANEFDPDGLGVITVSERTEGSTQGYFIVDGQHRWAAAKKVGHPSLKAQVFSELTKADEAALFRLRNNTKIVSSLDRFRIKLIEGEPVATELNKMLADNGWHLGLESARHSGAFWSVGALEWVYKGAERATVQTPSVARLTVELITAAWGHDNEGMKAGIVKGLGAFLVKYQGTINYEKLVREMAKAPGGPMKLLADAKFTAQSRRIHLADAVAGILTDLYNRKLGEANRLPEWTRRKDRSDG